MVAIAITGLHSGCGLLGSDVKVQAAEKMAVKLIMQGIHSK